MAKPLKYEDLEKSMETFPNRKTTKGKIEWLKHLANTYFDSEWEAMHDEGFRKLLKNMVEETTPEEHEYYTNQDPNRYFKEGGYDYNNLKSMYDEGEKGLDRLAYENRFIPGEDIDAKKKRRLYPTDFGFPSIASYDDDIKSHSRYDNDYSDVVESIMGNAETEGMSEKDLEKLRGQVTSMVDERANELFGNSKEDEEPKIEKPKVKDIDTNDNGKVEVDELAAYTKDLEDYLEKNPKAKDKNYY